jgi:hypothetical protein
VKEFNFRRFIRYNSHFTVFQLLYILTAEQFKEERKKREFEKKTAFILNHLRRLFCHHRFLTSIVPVLTPAPCRRRIMFLNCGAQLPVRALPAPTSPPL